MNEINQESLTKGEGTRNRIIDAAYRLFLEQGYHGTSMRQIVKQTGITMGGIYNHFSSKEDIWKAVLIDKHPYHEMMPLLIHAQGDTIGEFMQDIAHKMVTELGKHPDLLNLMFIEIVEFKGKDIPDLFEAVQPHIQQLAQVVTSKNGKLRDIPYPVIARSFAGLFFSYFITGLLIPENLKSLRDERALDDFIDIYLHGILESTTGK